MGNVVVYAKQNVITVKGTSWVNTKMNPKLDPREPMESRAIMKIIGPSGGETDEDEDGDDIPLRHNTVYHDECPTGLCLESKPTCTRSGGKVIQVKPRDKTPRILQCDAVVCKNAKCHVKKTLFVLLGYV